MKTLLALCFGASFLGTAAFCALAAERMPAPAAAVAAVAPEPAGPDDAWLRPSLGAPVRVVLASPYVSAR